MSDRRAEVDRQAHILIIPRAPSSPIDPEASLAPRRPDEIDEAIDDLFGPDPSGSPGWFDVVLLTIGLGLVIWARAFDHSDGFTVLGAIVAFLGSVFPLRSAWRAAKRWRRRRRRAELFHEGVPLNVGSPVTRALVDAYEELLTAAKLSRTFEPDVLNAGQLAMIESASLLGGGVPSNAAEKNYVEKRTAAIRELAQALEHRHCEAERAKLADGQAEGQLEREARTRAGKELDAAGLSSLRDLGDLKQLMEES
jgi:hypothetical protein